MAERLRHELRLLLTALQFLTRCPVPAWVGHSPALMQAAVRYFPLVGAAVGAVGASLALAALRVWPPFVAATVAVAGMVWLTAAFHEDGLADTFDALLGAAPREKALAIMKDSRIGTYGAAALLLALLLRVLLLGELLARSPAAAAAALIAAQAAGRAAAVVLMASLPYAREGALGPAGTEAREAEALEAAVAGFAGLLAIVAAGAFAGAMPPIAAATLTLVALVLALRRWLMQRLGGYTGDTLGATAQLGELLVLLAFSARVS